MDWNAQVIGYCERTDTAFWSEPVNALTNLAFILAALVMWMRAEGHARKGEARLLAVILFSIGIGSGLFHTLATRWAGLADTLPILLFILAYIHLANRHYLALTQMRAGLVTLLFVPFVAITLPVFARLPFFEVSAAYWPVPLLIGVYAVMLRSRSPATARGLAIGAGILVLSLTFRSLDRILCDMIPLGTHFLWHILNAVMLGWMIEVLLRHDASDAHRLAGNAPRR